MKYSCYYIIHLGCLLGFTMHFYITFGTNLLTQSPVPVSVFPLVLVFRGKGISNGVQTEWNLRKSYFWKESNTGDLECTSGDQRGEHEAGGSAHPPGRTLHPRGPLMAHITDFFRLYIPIYPKTFEEQNRSGVPPLQASVPVRSHLGTFSGDLPEGESTTEGFYINTIALPMKRE